MAAVGNKASMYIDAARAMQWPDIRRLWANIKKGDTRGWPPGRALEHLIVRAFELEPLKVAYPYNVIYKDKVIEQIDGLIYLDDLVFLVECKDTRTQGYELMANMRYRLERRPPCTLAAVFINGRLSATAREIAEVTTPHRITLWEDSDIERAIAHQTFKPTLLDKYRYLCQYGLLDQQSRSKQIEEFQ